MKWFEGSISEAVTHSKKNNAVFVVFIEGKDETSKVMLSAINKSASSQLESSSFVVIKLESESESYNQFREIYKLVPVPSMFFIGQNGHPLEIVAGENNVEENIVQKLEAAVKKCIQASMPSPKAPPDDCGQSKAVPSTSQNATIPENSQLKSDANVTGNVLIPDRPPIDSESKSDESAAAVNSSPEVETPPESQPKSAEIASSPTNSTDSSDQKERIMELIEKRREERKIQEEMEEKEREIKRRKLGQSLAEARQKQQDRELEDLRSEQLKEKEEERKAKQRVLDQIAQDRKERASRFPTLVQSPAANNEPVIQEQPRASPPPNMDSTRLQFRLPDGQSRNHSFPAETTLGQVRQFIDNNIVLPFREYQLATAFPRREFNFRDNDRNLRSLQLLPSAVIYIMPVQGALSVSNGGWARMFVSMFWDLMQPFFTLTNYIQSLIWGTSGGGRATPPRGSTPPPTSRYTQQPPPSQTVVRKRGNIHSLADNESSNDENNTWNGNSTQQM